MKACQHVSYWIYLLFLASFTALCRVTPVKAKAYLKIKTESYKERLDTENGDMWARLQRLAMPALYVIKTTPKMMKTMGNE